jgi:hypothetical protein
VRPEWAATREPVVLTIQLTAETPPPAPEHPSKRSPTWENWCRLNTRSTQERRYLSDARPPQRVAPARFEPGTVANRASALAVAKRALLSSEGFWLLAGNALKPSFGR